MESAGAVSSSIFSGSPGSTNSSFLTSSSVDDCSFKTVLFISSFSLWEWLEIVIFEHDELTEQILLNRHLSKIRVVFKKDS